MAQIFLSVWRNTLKRRHKRMALDGTPPTFVHFLSFRNQQSGKCYGSNTIFAFSLRIFFLVSRAEFFHFLCCHILYFLCLNIHPLHVARNVNFFFFLIFFLHKKRKENMLYCVSHTFYMCGTCGIITFYDGRWLFHAFSFQFSPFFLCSQNQINFKVSSEYAGVVAYLFSRIADVKKLTDTTINEKKV